MLPLLVIFPFNSKLKTEFFNLLIKLIYFRKTLNKKLYFLSVVQVGKTYSKEIRFPDRSQMLPSWITESTTEVYFQTDKLQGKHLQYNLLKITSLIQTKLPDKTGYNNNQAIQLITDHIYVLKALAFKFAKQ